MTASNSREIRLAARPVGWPVAEDFDLVEVPIPAPGPGQVLIRNLAMSVDPAMRGRMNDVESYAPPFEIGAPMQGLAVGEVVMSDTESVRTGDLVLHNLGWREHAVVDARHTTRVDPDLAPPSAYLGVLGMPGLTAYAGMLEVAALAVGDVVFVSGAAGAVGSVAGQVARLKGAARVIGSAGSPEKVRYLTGELGFDAAFDYKDGPVADQLRAAAPEGIDVYFDNVGGEHLEAAIGAMRRNGRIAMCGGISGYNATEPPPGPRNLLRFVARRLTMRGFLVIDHADLRPEFLREVGGWVRDGSLRYRETVVEGLENAPAALIGMMRGENMGKMVVTL
ncbi:MULTISPECIES: NADP-dependent oxidoreductase [Actinoalloteichus]|uniref:NADP-dependent oxidoreductase n=1 Tax=Actinoalloteichus fjordicus TaxID=1612552 RepID=A0AAC9LIT6_9PSEU|nr:MULTISPECIES: NADP-dependent oxidoreductase [Actinoalloteichus]APU17640.1 putative NADP-dependent oxidoreductase [Actinoalloteichus fjordicus]APU23716.1 putative NADP-dependent oxidoreductase [Actinoalloteichus sp. GBA129-24]